MSSSTFAAFATVVALAACTCACGRPTTTAASNDGAPTHAPPAAPERSVDASASSHWSGCDERKGDGVVMFTCGQPRVVVRARLPEMTTDIFEINARRFFEPFPGAAPPARTTVSFANGVTAPAMESTVKAPSADAGSVDAVLMAVGVTEADGSGLFMACSGESAASCKADIEALYAYDRH